MNKVTKPYQANFYNASAQEDLWYTVLDVTGKGMLRRASIYGYYTNEVLQLRITADGNQHYYNTIIKHQSWPLLHNNRGLDALLYLDFNSRLIVEAQRSYLNNKLECTVDYALE